MPVAAGDDAGHAHPGPRQLLGDEHVLEQAEAEAAVLLVDHDAEEAHLAHLGHEVVGHLALHRIELVGEREDLVHGELPGQVADHETVVGGVGGRERRGCDRQQIHGGSVGRR